MQKLSTEYIPHEENERAGEKEPKKIYIGTAGIPHSVEPENGEELTLAGIRKIKELSLSAMEIEFVKGIYIKEELAKKVKEASEKYGVILTAHAPYYINFGNPEKAVQSEQILLQTIKIADLCGIKSIAFHPSYYMGQSSEVIFNRVKNSLKKVIFVAKKKGILKSDIRPETAGKIYQFGDLDEIIKLCKEIKELKPCIDFAHIYARSKGQINGYDGFMKVMEKIHKELGDSAIEDMHCHIEGIEFDSNGEKRHVDFEKSEIDIKGLAKALKESKVKGVIICESPSLEKDALILAEILM